jgi:galactoside O-acetyltransferase
MNERDDDVRRRMAAHELYTDGGPGLEDLAERRVRGKELAHDYNEMLGSVGTGVWVEPPLHVAYGDNVVLGDEVYVNFGLTVVDDVAVVVGDRVMIAPNVTISTTGHPVHPEVRRDGSQFSAPVHLGDDVWVGAGAVILPGVTVGAGSVVAAGAVVTAHVPPMVVVGGVPARVLREVTDADRDHRWREPRSL